MLRKHIGQENYGRVNGDEHGEECRMDIDGDRCSTKVGCEIMNKKQLRWSQLMSNLESVVQAAFDMRNHQDMTENQYDIFNDAIWRLEQLAREIKGDDE